MKSIFLPQESVDQKVSSSLLRHQAAREAMGRTAVKVANTFIETPGPSLPSNAIGEIRSTEPPASDGPIFDFEADLAKIDGLPIDSTEIRQPVLPVNNPDQTMSA